MADKKISDFTAATTIAADDLIEIETSGGNSRKVKSQHAGIAGGTSFPGSPSSGDRFWRSDRGIEYYYDGTRWLSTQIFTLPIADNERTNTHTTTGAWAKTANPWSGIYDIYVTHAMLAYFLSGTGNWTVTVTPNGNGSAFNSGAFSTSGAWTKIQFGGSTVFTSALVEWETSVTENSGTATLFGGLVLVYRLVG